jgi:4'-phosphopantetheinyl transferase
MPLVHSEKIEEASTLLLWKLSETVVDLHEKLDATFNYEDLESISHPQKQREWLASRLLIKILAEELGVNFKGTYKDTHGKVYLSANEAHISITHTLDYVAAILNPVVTVGIDMEKLDPKLQRTSRKYLNEKELIHANDEVKILGMYWCAKEAVYKHFGKTGISFKDDIYVLPFSENELMLKAELKSDQETIQSNLHIRWFEDYCLAISI